MCIYMHVKVKWCICLNNWISYGVIPQLSKQLSKKWLESGGLKGSYIWWVKSTISNSQHEGESPSWQSPALPIYSRPVHATCTRSTGSTGDADHEARQPRQNLVLQEGYGVFFCWKDIYIYRTNSVLERKSKDWQLLFKLELVNKILPSSPSMRNLYMLGPCKVFDSSPYISLDQCFGEAGFVTWMEGGGLNRRKYPNITIYKFIHTCIFHILW